MKTYLFAGASSVIAQSTKELFQKHGHRVIGISTKNESQGYDSNHTVSDYGMFSFPDIEEKIDGLVYFSGTINLKPFHRLKTEDFQFDYQVNALGAVNFIQKYLPNLKLSPTASIVLISSVAASLGLPFHSSIAMAKGAVEGLTKALAAEFAPAIRVNCVAPSLVDTPLGEKFLSTPDKIAAMENRNPMHKVGEPIEVAKAIFYLLSEDSSWVTGQILHVDGGMGTLKNN
jgi:NAD(P)-dependent dehydrogenase (short-subunit alcohol dehydrogenase family)